MEGIELILKYFPELSDKQKQQFSALEACYAQWNAKINVISRKDFDSFYLHHVLHSLAIAKVCRFKPGAKVIDVGCGGGFPSIPLSILFPEVDFTAVDSIAKKIRVVEGVAKEVGIVNIHPVNARVENIGAKFDYIVSRAVTAMPQFLGWTWGMIRPGKSGTLENGILYLKGGDLSQELSATGREWTQYEISEFFEEEFFQTKKVVYTPKR